MKTCLHLYISLLAHLCWRSRGCCVKDEKSFAWECAIGHNSPPQFCRSGAVGIKTLASGAEVVLAPSAHDHALYRNSGATIIRQWNLTKSSNHSFACHETPAFFINIPYSNTFDGKVNYYHYHVDVLLPLFVAFQRASHPVKPRVT